MHTGRIASGVADVGEAEGIVLRVIIIIIIIIIEAFIKRRIPGKTTCSKALQYSSNKVVIKIK